MLSCCARKKFYNLRPRAAQWLSGRVLDLRLRDCCSSLTGDTAFFCDLDEKSQLKQNRDPDQSQYRIHEILTIVLLEKMIYQIDLMQGNPKNEIDIFQL